MKSDFLILLLLTLTATACDKEYIFKGQLPNPKLVLYSFIEPDSLIEVRVSRTRIAGQSNAAEVRNVEGEIHINNQFKGKLYHITGDRYGSHVYASPGDRINLTVRADGVEEVKAETVVPDQRPFISIDMQKLFQNKHRVNFRIKISEQNSDNKYYRLVIKRKTNKVIENYTLGKVLKYENENFKFDRSKEPLLVYKNDILDNEDEENGSNIYNIFGNELFRGRSYTLKVSTLYLPSYEYDVEYTLENEKGHIRNLSTYSAILYRIDEASWLYLRSEEEAYRNPPLLSEPVKVYSNVRKGVGVVGSFTKTEISIQAPVEKREAQEATYNPFYQLSDSPD